jgi:hypothetical protein
VLGDRIKRYTIVDLSGTLRDRQHQRIIKQQPELAHKVIWADSLPDQFDGVVVGNEVLDAMPVKLLNWTGAEWLERGVSVAPDSPADTPVFVWADRAARTWHAPPLRRARSPIRPRYGDRNPRTSPRLHHHPGTTHGQRRGFFHGLRLPRKRVLPASAKRRHFDVSPRTPK